MQASLLRFITQSKLLFERNDLSKRGLAAQSEASQGSATGEKRLRRWQIVLGSPTALSQRVQELGLDESRLLTLLGDADSAPTALNEPLPEWAKFFPELIESRSTDSLAASRYFLVTSEPFPFQEVFLSWVTRAVGELRRRFPKVDEVLTPETLGHLQRELLRRLTFWSARVFQEEFVRFRLRHADAFTLTLTQYAEHPGNGLYKRFVQSLQGERLRGFFASYPVLARLLTTFTLHWIDNTGEFVERYRADKDAIARLLECGTELVIVGIDPSLSDPHNGGKRIHQLEFQNGAKLIYKPRSVAMEGSFERLLGWCQENEFPIHLMAGRVIERAGYGWMEYIEHQDCETETEIELFYERCGALLGLVYLLSGNDFHYENLIAAGAYPVLVDLEALFHHERMARSTGTPEAKDLAHRQLQDSVLYLGFLPQWSLGPGGEIFDISGLGSQSGLATHFTHLDWRKVNTDAMECDYILMNTGVKENLPTLKGCPQAAEDYVPRLASGFRKACDFVRQNREAFLSELGPLMEFSRLKSRHVFRATRAYASLSRLLTAPTALRHGIDWSIETDLLARNLFQGHRGESYPEILVAEQRAMISGDIPFFEAEVTSGDLRNAGQLVLRDLLRPSYPEALRRIRELGEADIDRQCGFIKAAFACRHPVTEHFPATPESHQEEISTEVLQPAVFLAESEAIAAQLLREAVHSENTVTWIGMEVVTAAQRLQLVPVGLDLYSGLSGIAFYLAALSHVSGERRYREVSLKAFATLRNELRKAEPEALRLERGIGFGTGLSGIIYALTLGSQWLDEPSLLEEAIRLGQELDAPFIESVTEFDFISGLAGAVPGLLALADVTKNPVWTEQALACGERLLAVRTLTSGGFQGWGSVDKVFYTGFAHGSAGVSHALLGLFEISGEQRWREAILETHAYDRSVFNQAQQNWPDFRQPPGHDGIYPCANSWCHGAPGIGMERLLAAQLGVDTISQPEALLALDTARRAKMEVDHLCCGNAGISELFLLAGSHSGESGKLAEARRRFSHSVKRAQPSKAYRLSRHNYTSIPTPGFFQGSTGVGYTLLRLAMPDKLPSVLLGSTKVKV